MVQVDTTYGVSQSGEQVVDLKKCSTSSEANRNLSIRAGRVIAALEEMPPAERKVWLERQGQYAGQRKSRSGGRKSGDIMEILRPMPRSEIEKWVDKELARHNSKQAIQSIK